MQQGTRPEAIFGARVERRIPGVPFLSQTSAGAQQADPVPRNAPPGAGDCTPDDGHAARSPATLVGAGRRG